MPDWSYDGLGALGYTYELRPNSASGGGFELPESQILDACEENYNGAMEMIIWAADIQAGCTDLLLVISTLMRLLTMVLVLN